MLPTPQLLATARDLLASGDELRALTRLREAGVSAPAAAAAVAQVRLRARAQAKFGPDTEQMWFTPDGLEQATAPAVAAYRAGRIARYLGGTTGVPAVADLCCGIGGDLIALARAGLSVTGIELDPATAAIARANVAALNLTGVSVRCADALQTDLTAVGAFVIDPARRSAGRRTFDPNAYRPAWPAVTDLLRRHSAVAKVAPGIPHEAIGDDFDAEWVSTADGLKETAVWSGGLRDYTGRRATIVFTPQIIATMHAGLASDDHVAPPGRYLYEPDPAVIRAGLVTNVCALTGGWLLDPHIAYLSADSAHITPFADCFEIIETLTANQVRRYVGAQAPATLEIKIRGVSLDPAVLHKQLAKHTAPRRPTSRRTTAEPLTLIYTRTGSRHPVFAARRLTNRGDRELAAQSAS